MYDHLTSYELAVLKQRCERERKHRTAREIARELESRSHMREPTPERQRLQQVMQESA